ncbi:hypothetical protein C0993_002193 [Termitomyces sp. T159_Od127]|nr:hypothetical protein C0993_002193 [Termitomyces sp. T159_Od127]
MALAKLPMTLVVDETARATQSFWLSHTIHEGPGLVVAKRHGDVQYRIRMLSVVLDGEARFSFSAIRVLTIAECADPLRDVGFPDSDDPGYRCRLTRRRVLRNESRRITDDAEMQTSPICTILLELVADTNGSHEWLYRPYVQLVPRPDVRNLSEFTIIFEHSQKCTPENPAVILSLESNGLLRRIQGALCSLNPGQPIVSMSSIRVVPADVHKRRCIHLPPKIVTRIAELIIGTRASPWRSELLSCGLVCRGWLHVLDLFFQHFDCCTENHHNHDLPHLYRVARCLKVRSERGALMRSFSDKGYSQQQNLDVDEWRQLMSISRCLSATNVTGVALGHVPVCIARQLADGLAKLRNVRCLVLGDYRPMLSTYDMSAIQALIGDWRELRKVRLMKWACPMDTFSISKPAPPLPSRIEELELDSGFLTTSQLARFTQDCNPCLRELRLVRIEGLSNTGLASFLSLVTSSLAILEISRCIFTFHGDEELAVDSLMPNLGKLYRLVVSGPHIISALSLSRKSAMRDPQHPRPRCTFVVYDAGEEMRVGDASQAIEVTGWNYVSIHWKSGQESLADSCVQHALEMATSRGIYLCYSAGGLTFSNYNNAVW